MANPTVKTKATIVGFSTSKKYAHMILERNNARIQVQVDMLKKYENTSATPGISDVWHLIGHYNKERSAFYFSPDLHFHAKKNVEEIGEPSRTRGISKEELMRISKPYSPTTIEDVLKEYSEYSRLITPEQNQKALNMITMASSNDILISNLLSFMGKEDQSLPTCESKKVEFKSGLNYQAINTIAAFANTIGGTLYYGLNNHGKIVGMANKLMHDIPFATVADFVNDFQNRIYLATKSHRFMASITFDFYKTNEGEVFFSLTVPPSSETILIDGVKLYVRDEAGTRLLKNRDMIQWIKTHSN